MTKYNRIVRGSICMDCGQLNAFSPENGGYISGVCAPPLLLQCPHGPLRPVIGPYMACVPIETNSEWVWA